MLIRKLRNVGDSYVITIPKSLCEHYNFQLDDKFSIEPQGINQIIIKKVIENV